MTIFIFIILYPELLNKCIACLRCHSPEPPSIRPRTQEATGKDVEILVEARMLGIRINEGQHALSKTRESENLKQ